ncbi:MAG: hypothetical protein L0226_03385 [Acidobacteria bacterium]|nr:hypothetical protein [Acidobacteriota bacterium]
MSRSVMLCIEGTQAEFERRLKDAQRLYIEAWDEAIDDYDACVAAHYIAHLEQDPRKALQWNLEALARADAVGNECVKPFYPSLYVNVGRSYELVGAEAEAQRYYDLAAQLGLVHQRD